MTFCEFIANVTEVKARHAYGYVGVTVMKVSVNELQVKVTVSVSDNKGLLICWCPVGVALFSHRQGTVNGVPHLFAH